MRFDVRKPNIAQGLVKGAKLCFRYTYFYFRHGESSSTASQLTSPASQKSKDLNKVPLLLQDLDYTILYLRYLTAIVVVLFMMRCVAILRYSYVNAKLVLTSLLYEQNSIIHMNIYSNK